MALRWRQNGNLVCAAKTKEEDNDTYIDDRLHYLLTQEAKIIKPHTRETDNSVWFWSFPTEKNYSAWNINTHGEICTGGTERSIIDKLISMDYDVLDTHIRIYKIFENWKPMDMEEILERTLRNRDIIFLIENKDSIIKEVYKDCLISEISWRTTIDPELGDGSIWGEFNINLDVKRCLEFEDKMWEKWHKFSKLHMWNRIRSCPSYEE